MKQLSEMTLQELWELFPIELVPHNDNWSHQYTKMESLLRGLFSIRPYRISHIGSTSVANIFAKNIVDVLVEFLPGEDLLQAAKPLTDNGFIPMSSSPTRLSLNYGYTPQGFAEEVFHIHLRYAGDNDELYFRDLLQTDPAVATEYEQLKLSLAPRYRYDRDGYTNAKSDFVRTHTAAAKSRFPDRYAFRP